MTLLEAIRQRHSVRQYAEKPIESSKLEELGLLVDEMNRAAGLHIQLITNDEVAFSSRLARYGKFSGVSNYFAMVGRKSDNLDELVGYTGEHLVLKAQQLGLNTCWVGLTYKKNAERVKVGSDEKVAALIALGYGVTQGSDHKRKTYEQVAKAKEPAPEWFRNGVEAAILAPTALNQQKFRFELLADETVKATAGWGFYTQMDLGIVKYHFEIGAGRENYFDLF